MQLQSLLTIACSRTEKSTVQPASSMAAVHLAAIKAQNNPISDSSPVTLPLYPESTRRSVLTQKTRDH